MKRFFLCVELKLTLCVESSDTADILQFLNYCENCRLRLLSEAEFLAGRYSRFEDLNQDDLLNKNEFSEFFHSRIAWDRLLEVYDAKPKPYPS